MNKASTKKIVFTALFAALICAGCFISIPLPGLVPITVQNMFAVLAGTVLGGVQGAAAVGIFLILGAVGIPVFSGVKGGFAILTGPTGGFLIGYFLGALVAGLILGKPSVSEKKPTALNVIAVIIATVVGFVLNYLPGIPWFLAVMAGRGAEKTVSQAMQACLIPFIPGDSIKIVVTIILTLILRPVCARFLYSDYEEDDIAKNSKK